MAKAPARKHDKVSNDSHGNGEIITGDPTVTFEGQPVACVDDTAKFADKVTGTIEEGQACVVVNGKRIALVGDETKKDGTIKEGASSIKIDEGTPFVFIGPNVHIGKNVSFISNRSENNDDSIELLAGIGLGILEELAGIPLDETGAGEVMQIDGAKRIIKNSSKLAIKIGSKIKKQMTRRGWNEKSIENLIKNPSKKVSTKDTRFNLDGTRNDDPATAYLDETGHYVVQNDKTGDIVQLSNKNDTDWQPPF